MRDVINQSSIWKIVGGVSAINGLVCFALSSTYDTTFGKLGFCGRLVYLLACLIMGYLIVWAKRIPVSEKVQGAVAVLFFVVICSISVVLDEHVTGKSDALAIISYGSFALMSVSMSRKLELGFETGFSAFFLQMFATKLLKSNRILLPIALVFCPVVIMLRHRPVQVPSTPSDSHDHIIEVDPPAAVHINEESQDSAGREAAQSLLSRDNEQNDQEESFKAASSSSSEQDHVSPANYQDVYLRSSRPLLRRSFSENPRRGMRMSRAMQTISDGDDVQNNERPPSLAAMSSYSSEQGHGSSAKHHDHSLPQLRRRKMTRAINLSIHAGFGLTGGRQEK